MKAVIRERYCETDALELREAIRPQPKKREVLVQVYCATVNRSDCGLVNGKPFVIRFFIGLFRPRNKITGTDFAGKVIGIGNEVTSFKLGDRVFGFNDEGLSSHAEYLTISEDKAIDVIPENIDFNTAVAALEGTHYAYNFLNKVSINKGDRILVNGATGAIGSSAVQLSINAGADVTAVCGTKNIALIKALGATHVVDYKKEDFTKLPEKFDLVFDTVGNIRFKECRPILTNKGIYISSELGPKAENIFLALGTKFSSKQKVIFPIPSGCRRSVLYISKLLADSKLKPLIDRIYPIRDVTEAFKFVKTGMKTGNVILQIKDETNV